MDGIEEDLIFFEDVHGILVISINVEIDIENENEDLVD